MIDYLPFSSCIIVARRYSLSDSPNAHDHFRISVKRERGIRAIDPATGKADTTQTAHLGWLSNLLHDTLNEGDKIDVAYPFGDFFLDDTASPVVLISAGVGLTPLTSMLHAALERPSPRPVSWIQVVHDAQHQALNAEVRRLLGARPDLVRRAIFYSEAGDASKQGQDYDVEGRMNLEKVQPETLRLEDSASQYYVCGPEQFMVDVGRHLRARGVDTARIHMEVFGAGAVPL